MKRRDHLEAAGAEFLFSAEAIAEALQTNSTLTHVDLSSNLIGGSGLQARRFRARGLLDQGFFAA